MILVDTSVIIGYLKGMDEDPYKKLDNIIDHNIPYGITNIIYQEVLQGSRNDNEFSKLKEYLETIPIYELKYGKDSYTQCANIYYQCRKKGIIIRSTIDIIIAETALENNLYLLHNDRDFENIKIVMNELQFYIN
jgi:predicted nucleic acid-binding protein